MLTKQINPHTQKTFYSNIIAPSATIFDAIKMIDTHSSQSVVIVDDTNMLLGIVTDGDIRRSILKGTALDASIKTIMNKNPLTLPAGSPTARIIATMRKHGIRQIPLIDAQKKVISVEFLDKLTQKKVYQNPVVIMAGGLGTRLRPLTTHQPKPLLKVGNKSVLEIIIERLAKHGFTDFFFTVNYLSDMIIDHFGSGERWGISISYIKEEKRLGTAGALSLLNQTPDLPFIVMNGDLLTKINIQSMLEFHHEHDALATMAVKHYTFTVPYGVVHVDKKDLITRISEKPEKHFFVNAGVYILDPRTLDLIPKNTFFDMTDLFEMIMAQEKATAFPIHEYWLDIGKHEDYKKASQDFTNGLI